MAGCVLVPEIKSLSSWISGEAGTRALSKIGFPTDGPALATVRKISLAGYCSRVFATLPTCFLPRGGRTRSSTNLFR